jgi:hypothetical protein
MDKKISTNFNDIPCFQLFLRYHAIIRKFRIKYERKSRNIRKKLFTLNKNKKPADQTSFFGHVIPRALTEKKN